MALFVGNFSPAVRTNYRIGLPSGGRWREAVNTDATYYGGSGVGNMGGFEAEATSLSRSRIAHADRRAPERQDRKE